MIYIMKCNPQHYYLLHEMGHRLGMPHTTIYKLTEEKATANVRVVTPSSAVPYTCSVEKYMYRICQIGVLIPRP